MWTLPIVLIACFAAVIVGKPQPVEPSTVIPIISQSDNIKPDGSFTFGYETGNGIKVEEIGSLKPNPSAKPGSENSVIQVLSGTYSYAAPDGTQINLKYLADENGFKPSGDHLPTAPPVPEEIRKALDLLARNDKNIASTNKS